MELEQNVEEKLVFMPIRHRVISFLLSAATWPWVFPSTFHFLRKRRRRNRWHPLITRENRGKMRFCSWPGHARGTEEKNRDPWSRNNSPLWHGNRKTQWVKSGRRYRWLTQFLWLLFSVLREKRENKSSVNSTGATANFDEERIF